MRSGDLFVEMIAIVRKNFACLISKHSSCVHKSNLSLYLSLHFFSTSKERELVTNHRVYDILVHKHHFSPNVASLVARTRNPEKADSILSNLKESGFSSAQLEKVVKYDPRILSAGVEDIKFKIKIFQDLGLSSEDIAKIISRHHVILRYSAKNKIIPSLSLLKGFLGCDYNVAKLLKKSSWFVAVDLEKSLVPNVEILKSCGIPMERILSLLYNHPRCLLIKPDIIRKSVDNAKEMGFSPSSNLFIHGVRVIASVSKEIWELKLQAFRDLGFSESDILAMFRKAPAVFGGSMEKTKKVKELLLATGKFNISSIVSNPASLGCSIEKRYKPRLHILGTLESKNLIRKWPSLGTLYTMSDDNFNETFVRPYSNEVGEFYVTKNHVNSKREVKL